jgi:hypothetical protein
MVKDAIQPHLQPLLDKQVILEETVSQLQNNNANLKAKIDLIDMRLEEQEQSENHVSLPVSKKPHYDGYFTIFCLAYWMRSTYVVQLSDVVCATLSNPDFISSIIPTIAEKVIQLMRSSSEGSAIVFVVVCGSIVRTFYVDMSHTIHLCILFLGFVALQTLINVRYTNMNRTMEPQTTTNTMADPSELEQSTPLKSQYISGRKKKQSGQS